ncbi:putative dehydrogenase [Sphingobacterium allocomposti]|uniref:Putative dehydrogenase n=1 Tax=Sphingobacterium allocomposti TaxID=415956 RepID=A0A5S5D7D8_9SPHI|nr:Gfo/Idh/MocA family oxidoreductase [Sphingobacterium composti Yoo et al. 2007 non Ten et al. 2007]TYP90956.1 putative dehydrogenase [Sphingobacterium composti Yoo et al. 2007 non Ten et al. 2007]
MTVSNISRGIRVGVIGIKGMGWSNLQSILKISDVTCTAICDIDDEVLRQRLHELKQRNIHPQPYKDYKQLLAASDVDAVIIATPDHWHCLQATDAMRAGKSVYVEKPLANSIQECDALIAVKNKYKSIVQVGQWQRSQQHFRDAISFVHSGKLGKIRTVKAWAYLGWKKRVPKMPDTHVPDGVDYLAWQGPAKRGPFNPNRFHYNFRWFWDYAGGLMTDWGVHLLDYALLGMRVWAPKSIMATGGKFAYPEDAGETPDTMTAVYAFDGFNIIWEHATGIGRGPYEREHGIAFIGNNGTLVLDRNGWEVLAENGRMEPVSIQKKADIGLDLHMANFVEAVRSGREELLNAPIEAAAHIAKLSHMGNIAYRTGGRLTWDRNDEQFIETDANKYLVAKYHNGYVLPKV